MGEKMGMGKQFLFVFVLLVMLNLILILGLIPRSVSAQSAQKKIARVELMPNIPSPFIMRDWKEVARGYDAFVFNFDAQGSYLPLITWDKHNINFKLDSFRLPSYVGQKPSGEGINQLAAIVGATLVGIDKSNQDGYNWVLTAKQYYNRTMKMIYNGTRNSVYRGNTFWYELFPEILFYQLVSLYPAAAKIPTPLSNNQGRMSMEEIMYSTANTYYDAAYVMGGSNDAKGYEWTSFDLTKMEPVFNSRWREPDAAAGIAWMQYMAYVKFGEEKFLDAADWSLRYLENMDYNPLYELLLTYGTYTAARMNAELGCDYNLDKLMNWCFEPSDAKSGWGRPGWGIIAENWSGYDVHGLQGSVTDNGGYAFAMNTYQWAAALVPVVRYDQRYARAIGKWMLNLANNARLFYATFHPDDRQSCSFWQEDPKGLIAYEGLRKAGPIVHVSTGRSVPVAERKGPYATGDALRNGWAPTDFGLYGSSHVGYLAGIIAPTNDEKILQIDLLATDFFRHQAYPTYLYYNPYSEQKKVELYVGADAVDLYDTTTKTFLKKNVSGTVVFSIPPDSAVVLVLAPANGEIAYEDKKMLIDGVIVDYYSIVLEISYPHSGKMVHGDLPVSVNAIVPYEINIDCVSLTANGQEIYCGSKIPTDVVINTANYENGTDLLLNVTVKTVDGITIQESIQCTVDNRLLSSPGAYDLSYWQEYQPLPARIETDGNTTTLTKVNSEDVWGGVISPLITLELERNPIFEMNGIYAPGKWGLFVIIADENGTSTIHQLYGPTNAAQVQINLTQEIKKIAQSDEEAKQCLDSISGFHFILANYAERGKVMSIWKSSENINLAYQD